MTRRTRIRRPVPLTPRSFEEQAAAQIRTLWGVIVALAAAVAIGMGLAAWGFVSADTATSQARSASRGEAKLAQQLAGAALQSASEIKVNRDASLLRECRDQNRRHRNTIRYIHAVGVREAHRKHISVRVAERQLRPFVLLMDAAIPHRDCQQTLARATGR